jgi:DNA-binding response OmpR family regulator
VRILVVEDDADIGHGLAVWLEAQPGTIVEIATDGVTAISLALRTRPDVVILDLTLPGADGYLVLTRFRHLEPLRTVPILVVSGRPRAIEEARCLRAGASAYFEKPFDFYALAAAITAVTTKDTEHTEHTEAPPCVD